MKIVYRTIWLGGFVLFAWTSANLTGAEIANDRKIVPVGRIGTFGSGVGQFQYPYNLKIDKADNVYVADTGNCRIVKMNAAGKVLLSFGSFGSEPGQFNLPADVAVDPQGNIYVADTRNQRVQKFTSDGKSVWQAVLGSKGQQYTPRGIALDREGKTVFVSDTTAHAIVKLNADGKFVARWGQPGSGEGQFQFPHGLTLDADNNLYVADFGNNRIQKFTSDGQFIAQIGKFGTESGDFHYPWGVTVDSSDRLWVVDMSNHRVQVFTTSGQFLFAFGHYNGDQPQLGEFNHRKGIAVSSRGDVWIAHPGVHGLDHLRLHEESAASVVPASKGSF